MNERRFLSFGRPHDPRPGEEHAPETHFERLCVEQGLRMNGQRRAILRVLDEALDHPCAKEVYERATQIDSGISAATVYRTLGVLVEAGLLIRLEFNDRRARYEKARSGRHGHLIDVQSGKVLEFSEEGIVALLKEVAATLGYRLVDYRLELFAEPDHAP